LSNQNLQDLTLSIPNQQAEACKEGCKTLIKVVEGFLCKHRNLPSNKWSIILIDLTYPKAKTKAENLYEMAAEKGLEERKKFGVCMGLKGGLFLEPCPK
jgi:hypothetical protein